jgi:hypothetical protein
VVVIQSQIETKNHILAIKASLFLHKGFTHFLMFGTTENLKKPKSFSVDNNNIF